MGKSKKNKTVKVGTTIEMDVNTEKQPKNESEMGKVNNSELIAKIADRKGTKDELHTILDENDMFKKKAKKLKEVKSVFSLRKQMLELFDADDVVKVRETMPKAERKPKAKAEPEYDAETQKLINGIKSATKTKQLKKLAKESGKFDWKQLKKLDFEEMQANMLNAFSGNAVEKAKEPEKPKTVPNPLIAEIDGFSKMKKLYNWASENEAFSKLKSKKKYETLEDLQSALKSMIPEEVEAETKTHKRAEPRTPRAEARVLRQKQVDFMNKKLEEAGGRMPVKELANLALEKWDDPKTIRDLLSYGTNPKYNKFPELLVKMDGDVMFESWTEKKEEKAEKSSTKKDKKKKKNKKQK